MSGSITLFMVSTTVAEYLIDKVTRSVPRRLSQVDHDHDLTNTTWIKPMGYGRHDDKAGQK